MPIRPGLFRGDTGLSVALGLAAFLSAAHVLMRTAIYGIPISGDTITYINFAETLAAGDGFGGELIQWPPLLSVALAFFRLFGIESVDTGRFLNIISIGLIVLVAGHWLRQHVRYSFVMIGVTVTIIVSYPLARISSYVLTETLFILITLLALIQMESFLSGRRAKSMFLFAIFLSALAPLLRWIGVTVIFTGVMLILTKLKISVRVRLKCAAIYGAASLLPVGLWLTRNWIVSGTLTGTRQDAAGQTLWNSLTQVGDLVYLWTFVQKEPGLLAVCLWTAGALIMVQAITFLIARRNRVTGFRDTWKERMSSSEDSKVRPAFPFAAFTMVYFVGLMVAMPYQLEHEIINRYLAPVYVPSVVMTAVWLDRFLLATYRDSGISVWKNSDEWGILYNKASGPIAVTKWITIGLIFAIILANNIRNITSYIDVLINYDTYKYLF